jgi:hypothetical protein
VQVQVQESDPITPRFSLSTDEKVALFRRLFRGRTDVCPVRWEGKSSGKAGYTPACANEWRAGACEKPRIKCGDCGQRLLIPLSDAVIYGHLAGEHTVGVYALLEDDSCYFLAVDFDEAEWQQATCCCPSPRVPERQLDPQLSLNRTRSKSGNSAVQMPAPARQNGGQFRNRKQPTRP